MIRDTHFPATTSCNVRPAHNINSHVRHGKRRTKRKWKVLEDDMQKMINENLEAATHSFEGRRKSLPKAWGTKANWKWMGGMEPCSTPS
jgi:hypothetical protein